jgi:hypothetical protein
MQNLNADENRSFVAASATEDIRDFLQNILHRANSIEENLSALERPRWAEPLKNIRLFALQALADCSGSAESVARDREPAGSEYTSHI